MHSWVFWQCVSCFYESIPYPIKVMMTEKWCVRFPADSAVGNTLSCNCWVNICGLIYKVILNLTWILSQSQARIIIYHITISTNFFSRSWVGFPPEATLYIIWKAVFFTSEYVLSLKLAGTVWWIFNLVLSLTIDIKCWVVRNTEESVLVICFSLSMKHCLMSNIHKKWARPLAHHICTCTLSILWMTLDHLALGQEYYKNSTLSTNDRNFL